MVDGEGRGKGVGSDKEFLEMMGASWEGLGWWCEMER